MKFSYSVIVPQALFISTSSSKFPDLGTCLRFLTYYCCLSSASFSFWRFSLSICLSLSVSVSLILVLLVNFLPAVGTELCFVVLHWKSVYFAYSIFISLGVEKKIYIYLSFCSEVECKKCFITGHLERWRIPPRVLFGIGGCLAQIKTGASRFLKFLVVSHFHGKQCYYVMLR
jgi:hypothetical protein